jgi:N-carbamoyl-L-amino-acid hydrolase
MDFRTLWETLAPIGRTPSGYRRYAWSEADAACRSWFTEQASSRGLTVETDRNGNLFAWLGDPAAGDAVVTGSHFDSVPDGGGYDGPLGVVSALLALDLLAKRGATPSRPIAVAVFSEEEGARFGVPCLGSRLLTGALDPRSALGLRDAQALTLAEAMATAGADPSSLGPDPERLARIGCFLELHIEQGRALTDVDAAVGVASGIWPHGRWRLDLAGEGNHAGTTAMADRRDPLLTTAYTVLAANKEARLRGGRATIGRIEPSPNATNAVPSRVSAWLDARAPDETTLDGLVEAIVKRVQERAGRDGTSMVVTPESMSPPVAFSLAERLVARLGRVPVLDTAAGHDACVFAGYVPTGMLFVRNPTGVSHAPAEAATDEDCAAGVAALADVLEDLACQ